jgi:hypothetical protein
MSQAHLVTSSVLCPIPAAFFVSVIQDITYLMSYASLAQCLAEEKEKAALMDQRGHLNINLRF